MTESTQINPDSIAKLGDLKRPPWDTVSTAELADILGVSIQVLSNWRIRKAGPNFLPVGTFRGNRVHYRICDIEAWLRSKAEPTKAWQVAAEWLGRHFILKQPLKSEAETRTMAADIRDLGVWKLAHYPRKDFPAA